MISKLYGIEYMVLFRVSENGLQGFGIAAPCLALNRHIFIPVADKEIQFHTGILMIIVQLAPIHIIHVFQPRLAPIKHIFPATFGA